MMEENVEAVEDRYGATIGDELLSSYSESGDLQHANIQPHARTDSKALDDEAIDVSWNHDGDATILQSVTNAVVEGQIRTLDGEIAGDEFNYQILLGKIDNLLDRLRLDA